MWSDEERFLERHKRELEESLSEAISLVMETRREDPLNHLVELLQQQVHTSEHKGVAAAKRAAFAASPSEPASDGADPEKSDEWSITSWMGGLVPSKEATWKRPTDIVAAALLRPLGDSPPPHVELQFMRHLGGNKEAVRSLLDGAVLDGLAESVSEAAAEMSSAAPSALELSNKFAESTFTLSYGGLDTFYEGLEGRIGAPNPNLREAMEREHCHSTDSQAPFKTPNYGVSTTSEIEWQYVCNPTDKQMQALSLDGGETRLKEWPGETHSCSEGRRRGRWAFKKKLQERALDAGLLKGSGGDKGGSGDGGAGEDESESVGKKAKWAVVDGMLEIRTKARITHLLKEGKETEDEEATEEAEAVGETAHEEAVHVHHPMLSAFEEELARKNEQLEAKKEPTLRMEEIIGGRMYTGPGNVAATQDLISPVLKRC